MTVICVNEECHGYICIAATVQDAIDYLLTDGWIDETTEVWDVHDQCWVSVLDFFGENWKDQIRSMNGIQFNDLFENSFSMEIKPVYERKR